MFFPDSGEEKTWNIIKGADLMASRLWDLFQGAFARETENFPADDLNEGGYRGAE